MIKESYKAFVCCVKHKTELKEKVAINIFDSAFICRYKDSEAVTYRYHHVNLTKCPKCHEEKRKLYYQEMEEQKQKIQEQQQEVMIKRAQENSGIPEKYGNASIWNFKIDHKPNELSPILEVYQDYYNNLKENITNVKNIIAVGKKGRGKTHLAIALMRQALELGFTARVDDLNNIMTKLKYSSQNRFLYATYDLLIIDDLAEIEWSEHKNSIFSLIGDRYNNRKTTIINTHLPSSETDKIFDTTRKSRLLETGIIVDFDKYFNPRDDYDYRIWSKSSKTFVTHASKVMGD